MGEFELIDRYFRRPVTRSPLGGGDDCALLAPAAGMHLAVSCDMLVEGRHFLADADPSRLGHKSLAVNLSDLGACGAEPLAFTLALALPQADDAWLAPFSRGLLTLADEFRCELVGGDTTRGPLNICITVFGQVPAGQALLRSGARAGDDIYVSGTLGDARLALDVLRGTARVPDAVFAAARLRLEEPSPRVALGVALRNVAHAAIDISDGLAGDLGHVLRQSGVGASVSADSVANLMATSAQVLSAQQRLDYALSGGDDYELAFTAAPAQRDAVSAAAAAARATVTRIGQIDREPGLRLLDRDGRLVSMRAASFDHFA